MNKIITIGREFGSGGRELGKLLAEKLQIAYYDSEIITEIAKKTALSEEYVERILEKRPALFFPFNHSGTLHTSLAPHFNLSNTIYTEQTEILRDMAQKSDCVIVGRCADYILREKKPFRIFVYADLEHRMARCRANAPENEHLSDKQLRQRILAVDKDRRQYYRFFTGQRWGERKDYDLSINTSLGTLADWAEVIAALVQRLNGN